MADQLAANPWTIDTATSQLARTIWGTKVHITNIEFVGYAVATDVIQLTDVLGNNLWDCRGATDFSVVRSGDIGIVNGVRLAFATPATAGLIKVYFK